MSPKTLKPIPEPSLLSLLSSTFLPMFSPSPSSPLLPYRYLGSDPCGSSLFGKISASERMGAGGLGIAVGCVDKWGDGEIEGAGEMGNGKWDGGKWGKEKGGWIHD